MKRLVCFLLVTIIAVSICGCTEHSEKFKAPATFYYLQPRDSLDLSESVLQGEVRETADCNGQLDKILNLYLAGPATDSYVSPFPSELFVLDVIQRENTVVVTLNSEFSQLEDIELSIAIICISSTLFELTECEEVELRANGDLINGTESVTITQDHLYMLDQYHNG